MDSCANLSLARAHWPMHCIALQCSYIVPSAWADAGAQCTYWQVLFSLLCQVGSACAPPERLSPLLWPQESESEVEVATEMEVTFESYYVSIWLGGPICSLTVLLYKSGGEELQIGSSGDDQSCEMSRI